MTGSISASLNTGASVPVLSAAIMPVSASASIVAWRKVPFSLSEMKRSEGANPRCMAAAVSGETWYLLSISCPAALVLSSVS